jgi:hypothetical protein
MAKNLLVVDFDYFFLNKLEGGYYDDEMMLYDWQHFESEMYRTVLWPSRGSAFVTNGLELPMVDIPENWWSRFNIAPDAVLEVSDSNLFSGAVNDYETYKHVWLYDAHHDLYGIKTEEQLEAWRDRGKMSCENWMFSHYLRGSKLHWRWPQWHREAKNMRAEIPKFVGCDARKDDMGPLNGIRFDAVSICRSGCWVPPWCDEQFVEFYQSCPVDEIVGLEDTEPREYKEYLEQHVKMTRMMDDEIREKRAKNLLQKST